MKINKKTVFLLLCGLLLAVAVSLSLYRIPHANEVTPPGEGLLEVPVTDLPEGTIYITRGRLEYGEGDMQLLIPAINVKTVVGDSTEWDALKERPGLYEFSQLPAEGDTNVSIAGHRDIYDMVFYYLDQVGEGDYLYLVYQNWVYRYLFEKSYITHANDWDVIAPQGYSCLTLTTCDPIGTSLNRLIVTGRLVDILPYDEYDAFE